MELIEQIETINKHLELLSRELMNLEEYNDYEIVLNEQEYQTFSDKKPMRIYSIEVNVSKTIERKSNNEKII